MVRNILLTLLSLLALLSSANASNGDVETLRKRFKAEAMKASADEGRVRTLMESVRPDGTWPGIDYVDTSRTAFQHTDHLKNLVSMALAYERDDSKLKKNKELKKKFDLALGHWLEKDYLCENWWSNQIGTPTYMVQLLYIMDKDLGKRQVAKMLEIAGRANMNASGARPSGDRARIASILAQTQLWCRNEAEVARALKIIEGEVKFSGEESAAPDEAGTSNPDYFPGGGGLQRDFSFHHRPDRVNNTCTYGVSFMESIIEWAKKVHDTSYRFSDKATHTMVDFFLDGISKQMVYGTMVDPGVVNREIGRPGASVRVLHEDDHAVLKGDPSMAVNLLAIAGGYRKAELEEIVASCDGDHSHTPSFAKFFWQTEHFVFQRPGFYTSVRMFSSRNMNMEMPYNGEGLTNHYRADGTNYLSVWGDEYSDIAPVYDFRKIPGATIMQAESMPPETEIQKSGLMDFVGGVTDGLYGAAAFDFISPHDPLRARKSWFFFDDFYLCLGSHIESEGDREVFTTLNQCYLRGTVRVGTPQGEFDKVDWVLHDGVGYAFLETPPGIGILNRKVTGNWQRLTRRTKVTSEQIEEDVFALWINHGSKVEDGHYAYAVVPNTDEDGIDAFSAHPAVEVLSNTKDLQAVYHPGLGIGYVVFYSGGSVTMDKVVLTSDTPLMAMVHVDDGRVDRIVVSDSSRTLLKAHFSVSGDFKTSNGKAKASFDSQSNLTRVQVELPQDAFSGGSVVL
ncbi:MAG: hypothetical protein IK076_05280 [Bacteroidales bacterium]|nr:hypothetical protein [Bacteroidales bacterium]